MKSQNLLLPFLSLILVGLQAQAQKLSCEGSLLADQADHQVFHSEDGYKLAFRNSGDDGSENVMVFLNGIDKSTTEWDGVRGLLQKKGASAKYIQLDLLGQGDTAALNPPTQDIPYQLQVKLLEDFLQTQKLQGKRLILVGHSYGGGIAARFANDHPNVVSDVVLIAPFVDNLENYQPGVGSIMAWTQYFSGWFGQNKLYENNLEASVDFGAAATWSMYSYSGRSDPKATLANVSALTRGIRNLGMTKSVANAGNTRFSMIISGLDELIPTSAHEDLWSNIPAANQGVYERIPYSHEAVSKAPELVVDKMAVALSFLF